MRTTDKTGRRYGHITVLRALPEMTKHHQRRYLCRCDCGTEFVVTSNNLREVGGSRSCGCKSKHKQEIMTETITQRVKKALTHCREAESLLADIKFTELTEYEFGIKLTAQGYLDHAAVHLKDLT